MTQNKVIQNKETVCAVVVTYNRKTLLMECLDALRKQTRPIDAIYIIDNYSNDGTPELLFENRYIQELPPANLKEPWEKEFPVKNLTHGDVVKLHYVRMNENTGGAGGFYEGVKRGYTAGYDWLWLMDDDAIPENDALQSLISAYHSISTEKAVDPIGLLCSHVEWTDGSPHVMNIPQIRTLIQSTKGNVYPFNEFINKGFVRIIACSFVSMFVSRCAIGEVGLPIKEMFMYGDDVEFTERICRQFACYYVSNSRVIHKTKSNSGVDILTAPADRLWCYFFDIRNKTFMSRRRGMVSLMVYITMQWTKDLKNALRRHSSRFEALKVCLTGLVSGLLFRPKVYRL